MKCIITGHKGGIGQALVKEAQNKGYEVIGLDVTDGIDINSPLNLDVGQEAIIINCAGITLPTSIEDVGVLENTKKVFEVNVFGTINVCHEVLKTMRKGAIINIASKAAFHPIPGRLAYCASKGAVVSLSKQLALDLAPHIRVNSISPGTVDTQMPGSVVACMNKPTNLLERKGTPEEIAKLVFDIAENEYITGQDIVIDGGYA